MRLPLISVMALLLLAAGCATSRPGAPEIAPSQQAGLTPPGAGWSVPPGSKQAPATTAQAPAQPAKAPDEAALAAADRAQREQARAKALAGLKAQPQPAAEPQAKPQPAVKPLVPAFPARAQEERVNELQTVHFGFDDWDLTPEARALLDANARWLKANPQVNVQIGGHCDERGSPEYNLALGERRARHVRDYLIQQGVPADNLTAVSYGEEMPVDPGHTEAAWAKNRRAEFSRSDGRRVSDSQARPPSS
jgi:peptidoglycan-associated lipoprotein